jgi:DMSO/TMAO reductase YedYZ molybdopterin-dependent catalytic subunit
MSSPEDVPGITPTEKLFRYDIFGLPGDLGRWMGNPTTYTLQIRGCVVSQKTYTLEQVRGRFEPVEVEEVLQCMTRVHWGRVLLRGARLADLLSDAGVASRAVKATLRGAEGYATDLLVEEILEHPQEFLVVYEMNGCVLTPEHGFPLRVAALGKYAYKWCKWLVEIGIVDYDFKGHYEGKRGWSDSAVRGKPVC